MSIFVILILLEIHRIKFLTIKVKVIGSLHCLPTLYINGCYIDDKLDNLTYYKASGTSTVDYALANVNLINVVKKKIRFQTHHICQIMLRFLCISNVIFY